MFFEFVIDFSILIILVVVVFFVGFIDVIVGGGGLLIIFVLFIVGVLLYLVLGINKLSLIFGVVIVSYIFYWCKLFYFGKWCNGLFVIMIGVVIGVWVVYLLFVEWLNWMFLVVVFICGFYMFFGGMLKVLLDVDVLFGCKCQWLQGFVLGFYDGVVGLGIGVFWIVSLLFMYLLDLVCVSGVVWSMNFVSNIVVLVVFIVFGQVIWLFGLCMGVLLMVGVYFGVCIVIGGGVKFICLVFILVVLVLIVWLVWQYWFSGV